MRRTRCRHCGIYPISSKSPELWKAIPHGGKNVVDFEVYKGLKWMTAEELLATRGLEAVAVETDGFELVPTALRCAEHGLHIHMDKPGGESLPDSEDCWNSARPVLWLFSRHMSIVTILP